VIQDQGVYREIEIKWKKRPSYDTGGFEELFSRFLHHADAFRNPSSPFLSRDGP
jgi:hypothetical protein